MRGTIIYKDYNVTDEHGTVVYLFGNTEIGESFLVEVTGQEPKYYPMTAHNLKVYDGVKALEKDIKQLEGRQKARVAELSQEGLE